MICILHGYLLDGSGSNLWTQALVRTLCSAGEEVHLVCQEPHPERFDFVARALRYDEAGAPQPVLEREVPYPGRCVLHKPWLGATLPVYVWDRYEEFARVVPLVELDDAGVQDYLRRNLLVLERVLDDNPISALHANHAVLIAEVARQVGRSRGLPYAVLPHGSALEYAVKQDPRYRRLAAGVLAGASRVLVHSPELHRRVMGVFGDLPGLEQKLVQLNLGVDARCFAPLERSGRRRSIRRLAAAMQGLGDQACGAALQALDWEQARVLAFVGRLIAAKGAQCVVAALPAVLRQEPRAVLVLVGHGPLRGPLEELLRALQAGDLARVRQIIAQGSPREGAASRGPLVHLSRYLERLQRQNELDAYLEAARGLRGRVFFTGFLDHARLRHLLPCCDVAAFPSVVPETGPLVFLEAMAAGAFPLGMDHAGTAVIMDNAAAALPAGSAALMRIRPDPEHTVADIARNALGALKLDRRHVRDLRQVALDLHDWQAVGQRFRELMYGMRAFQVAGMQAFSPTGGRCSDDSWS
jgi:glycosyltransferase involved in cell wall biosynthesis